MLLLRGHLTHMCVSGKFNPCRQKGNKQKRGKIMSRLKKLYGGKAGTTVQRAVLYMAGPGLIPATSKGPPNTVSERRDRSKQVRSIARSGPKRKQQQNPSNKKHLQGRSTGFKNLNSNQNFS